MILWLLMQLVNKIFTIEIAINYKKLIQDQGVLCAIVTLLFPMTMCCVRGVVREERGIGVVYSLLYISN